MKRNTCRPILLAGLCLTLASLACDAIIEPTPTPTPTPVPPTLTPTSTVTPTLTPTPTATPTPTPTPTPAPGDVLLRDDFSDPDSGWAVIEYENGDVGYGDGYYFTETTEEAGMVWGVASQSFSDVVIEVEATQVEAPANNNNGFGVMCRVQESNDGYLLRISGDGYAAIHRILGGSFDALVDWEESPAINQGAAVNSLRVVCDGSTLALYVNGELVAEATDTTFVEGDIGLAATTFEPEERTEIRFDNLLVKLAGGEVAE